MNSESLQNILYICLIIGMVMAVFLVSMQISLARLKQKNYFLNRDRERYAETLYASKDGYFAFIYPDDRIRDPRRSIRERCSRRLAVMLNLEKGIRSDFNDILAVFSAQSVAKINKYVRLLREEGIGFEDVFVLKNKGQSLNIFGARINGQDGNLYCDMLWFRDLSEEIRKNRELSAQMESLKKRTGLLEKMLDSLNFPLWLRDDSLNISLANRAYTDLMEFSEKNGKNIPDVIGKKTAQAALQTNKMQKSPFNYVSKGKAVSFDVNEIPCRLNETDDKRGTVGYLEDKSEVADIKRNFKIHQTAHLDVLSALGTAFAIFDTHRCLVFYNKAFAHLWNLMPNFLDTNPQYGEFLDEIRKSRLLPEVSDYKQYKSDEEKVFSDLLNVQENLLHIPDGRTFKRMISPYPNGIIFAYEDVSDRLAATRMINEQTSVQQNILDQIRDAVLIFDSDQNLRYCNQSYQKLWHLNEVQIKNMITLDEILELQRPHLNITSPWQDVKQSMLKHILTLHARFAIECRNGITLEVSSAVLSDDSVMITYMAV